MRWHSQRRHCLTRRRFSASNKEERAARKPAFRFMALDTPPIRHYNGGMAFVRTKRIKNRIYYYLVESRREGNRVRQKVLKYLGAEAPTEEEIEAMRRER